LLNEVEGLALNRMIADRIEFHASQEVAISQQKRKRTEEPFGWGKTIGGLARPMLPWCEFPRLVNANTQHRGVQGRS
jgi:hypothetical protein